MLNGAVEKHDTTFRIRNVFCFSLLSNRLNCIQLIYTSKSRDGTKSFLLY